jgi:acetylornithine/succinyldiaminopimelate/putrescine aminotransferase
MSNEYFTAPFRPLLPSIKFIQFNSKEDLEKITTDTSCVIAELIKAENGCLVGNKNYFKALRNRCTETGTLLILDEAQTAFGRTGSWFAFQQYEIVPDVLVLAKSFGGGMPLGAFISSKEIMHSLSNNPVLGHITTFGGHPVCCAASLAAINVLEEEKIIEHVFEKEKIIRNELKHPAIKNISGRGLLLSVEFENEELNKKINRTNITHGVFTDWFLFAPHCLRIAPPLNIENNLLIEACKRIVKSVDASV